MTHDDAIGPRIAALREEKGLSQSALARLMGSSQSAVSQIESGERNPSFETIRQIAKALGVPPSHLVGAPVPGLAPQEEAHFRLLRSLPPDAKQELVDFAAYLRHKHQKKSNS